MTKTWVVADPHFGHANILNFKRPDGSPLRDFPSVEAMDETMILNWNNAVRPDDRVYLLGDVAFHSRVLRKVIPRLLGRIVLVKGNHDTEKLSVYSELFDDVRAYVVKKGVIMSHVPIHPGSLSRWQFNVHGHLHSNVVKDANNHPDERYVCVSMEHTDYTPYNLDNILKKVVI